MAASRWPLPWVPAAVGATLHAQALVADAGAGLRLIQAIAMPLFR